MIQTPPTPSGSEGVAEYHQPPAGNTERFIGLRPRSLTGATSSSYLGLKEYGIDGTGSGPEGAEKIIRHIFQAKLKRPIDWQDDLWLKTLTVEVECEIFDRTSGRFFDELRPATLEQIAPKFATGEGPNRKRIIEGYAKEVAAGAKFPPPLYVTGSLLNLLGAEVDPRSLWMLDGARRLTAAALAHHRTVTVRLLVLEDEYPTLVDQNELGELKEELSRLSWFNNYQSIPMVGLKGERTLRRYQLMDMSLLRDCTVMDFGCNVGQASLRAVQAGARAVWGVEGMPDTWSLARRIGQVSRFANINYLNVNFNSPQFDREIDTNVPDKVDYSFFFSVYRTKELTQRDRLFRYIIEKTRKGIFFEGHAHPKIDSIDYYDWLFESFGLTARFLGFSEGTLRPLFFIPIKEAARLPAETGEAGPAAADDTYLVSAIVSTYKSERFIEGKLHDLLRQTLGNRLQIVVIDSGSPEGEKEIVERYAAQYPNITFIRTEERETVYQAWNRGLRVAKGRYVTNANTDDRLRPDALERLAQALDANPQAALAYGDFLITCTENMTFERHIRCGYSIKPDYAPAIMLSGCHMGPQPMWRKSVHDEIGYFDESFVSAGDYEFWCRLALKHSMVRVPEFLGLYLHNPTGIANSDPGTGSTETARVKTMYRGLLPAPCAAPASGYYHRQPVRPGGYVNIGMVTYNRLEFTRRAIEALLRYTRFPHVVTVIDNGSTDGTRDYLARMKELGAITNLVLLDENVGVAKASNLAWSLEPEADYYLKLDNDIVIGKPDWLEAMVAAVEAIPEAGAIAYNFEPQSYPLSQQHGHEIRIKQQGNLGGACILIPRRTHERLGWWCEDYGLYSEEDADYGFRIRCAGLLNCYLPDEEIGLHLPAGKAAVIDTTTMCATDGREEHEDPDYRRWKDEQRRRNVGSDGALTVNARAYFTKEKPLYVDSDFVRMWQEARIKEEGASSMALSPKTGASTAAPLVTVLVSSYNAEAFMRECLTDLMNQTIADRLEIIVVDAASPQAEGAVVADFQRRHDNITYLRTGARIGVYPAWNLALKLARGKYVTPFSTNDRLRPDAYEIMVAELEKRPDVALVYGDSYITGTPHETFERHTRTGMFQWPEFSLDQLLVNCMVGPHPMWRRSVHDEIGLFDESYVALGDQDFFIRVALRHPLLHIPQVTGLYWMSDDGLSNQQDISSPELVRLRQTYPPRRQAAPAPAATPTPRPTPAPAAPAVEPGLDRARALVEQGKHAEAAELLRGTSSQEGLVLLGDCQARLGQLADAEAAYRRAAASGRESHLPLIGLGVIHLLSGKPQEAAAEFRRALALSPRDPKALAGLGLAVSAAGNPAEAIPLLADALSADAENAAVLHELVKAAYLTNRYAAAEKALERYLMHHPADFDMLFSLAGVRFKGGNLLGAEDALDKILIFAPDYEGAAELKQKIDQSHAPQVAPKSSDAAARGRGLREEKRYEEALQALDEALRGGDRSVLADIGDCRAKLGQFAEAGEAYRQALSADPGNVQALTGLGILALVSGDGKAAIGHFSRAINGAPTDAAALAGLGMAQALEGDLSAAFGSLKKALQADPENLPALHELIKLSYRLGRHGEAEDHLSRYLMYHPVDLDLLFSLSGLQYAGGRHAAALDTIEKVLIFAPDYEGAEELRRKIAEAA